MKLADFVPDWMKPWGFDREAEQRLLASIEPDHAAPFEVWKASDDFGVCERCRALDGQIFPRHGGPFPPLHARCRCRRAPVYGLPDPADTIRQGLGKTAEQKRAQQKKPSARPSRAERNRMRRQP